LNRIPNPVEPEEPQERRLEPDLTSKSAWLLLSRGLRRRCPNCGAAGIFDGYFELKERCPNCGILLERGEGDYFLGGYAINLIAVEVILAGVFVLVLVLTWPNPPWDFLQWGGVALAIGAPIVCYPISKGAWLAVDLIFRPPKREDFVVRVK
jgi:uncharacterized protein (DUF983 family)